MVEKLRWGILGTAEIARELLPGMHSAQGSELVAIAGRDPEKAELWAKQYNIPKFFGSYQDLLDSDEVDMVYIPLPNSLHAKWTIEAIKTGHHVLCEKPLSANADEALQVARAAKKADRYVTEGFMYRFHPQWDKVIELIESDAIGRVCTLHGQFTFYLDDPNANLASKEMAGGALMDVGCYCINFFRMITKSQPILVSALAKAGKIDRTMVGILEFPNSVLAHFETGINNFERHRAEIAGTKGSILVHSPWIPGDNQAMITLYREGQKPETFEIPPANSYTLQVQDFVNVCAGIEKPRWTIRDAVSNMYVLDALAQSAKKHSVVQL